MQDAKLAPCVSQEMGMSEIRRAVELAIGACLDVSVQLNQMKRSTVGRKPNEYDCNLLHRYSEKLLKAQQELVAAIAVVMINMPVVMSNVSKEQPLNKEVTNV